MAPKVTFTTRFPAFSIFIKNPLQTGALLYNSAKSANNDNNDNNALGPTTLFLEK